jgi:hypothetical protein
VSRLITARTCNRPGRFFVRWAVDAGFTKQDSAYVRGDAGRRAGAICKNAIRPTLLVNLTTPFSQGSARCGILTHDHLSWKGLLTNRPGRRDRWVEVRLGCGRIADPSGGGELFFRKQFALYVERQLKPQRADDATGLRWRSCRGGWIDWRRRLTVVQPDTLIRWHRQRFQSFWRWNSKPPAANS